MPWVFSQQTPFYDLAYADDTALVAGTADRAEQLLSIVETIASHSNLQLNGEKSVLLKSPSSQNPVYNQHGNNVKEVEHAKYLGVFLSRNGTMRKDVTECLRKAKKHFNTRHHFWRHTGLPLHRKLRINKAVFVPMSVYGMESAALTSQISTASKPFTSRASAKCAGYLPHFTPRCLHQNTPSPPTSNSASNPHSHPSHTTSTGHNSSCLVMF